MNKVKIKGIPFRLIGESINVGDKLVFQAKDINDNVFDISTIKSKKILSVFPDINTKVCDMQTHELSRLAQEHPHVPFVSITMDSVETIKQWCLAKDISNLIILSDKELHDFTDKTKLLLRMINKLARGFILLDENNFIIDMVFKEELSQEPDFEKVKIWIKNWE